MSRNYPVYHAIKRDNKKRNLLMAVCIIAVLMEILKPALIEDNDFLISPDMESYIETYGVTVDEYGVE